MTEHGRKVYSNIQRPFCWGLERVCKNHANAPVVSTTPTGGMATTPTTTVPSKPRHVGICTCVSRPTQLQQAPVCTNWNGIPGARQTTQMTDICTALQKRFCHQKIVQTLPVPKDLDEGHAWHAYFGSSLVQAQIPDQPIRDPKRPNHCSNRWTSKNTQNKCTATTS